MKRNKQYTPAEPPCAELRPDDGIDPAVLFGRQRRPRGRHKKDRQLCGQAFKAFCMVMDQLAHMEWATDLFVAQVTPAPDASRLRVSVGVYGDVPLAEALHRVERLTQHTARFRWELGQAISRKRVPEIFFELTKVVEHDG